MAIDFSGAETPCSVRMEIGVWSLCELIDPTVVCGVGPQAHLRIENPIALVHTKSRYSAFSASDIAMATRACDALSAYGPELDTDSPGIVDADVCSWIVRTKFMEWMAIGEGAPSFGAWLREGAAK